MFFLIQLDILLLGGLVSGARNQLAGKDDGDGCCHQYGQQRCKEDDLLDVSIEMGQNKSKREDSEDDGCNGREAGENWVAVNKFSLFFSEQPPAMATLPEAMKRAATKPKNRSGAPMDTDKNGTRNTPIT